MGFLKADPLEEEEVETEERVYKPRRVASNSEFGRRKKKEPLKPWTKRDRYLVFYILLFTILISGALAMSAREWKLPGFPRITLPSLNIFKGETIVIEGDNKTALSKQKAAGEKIIKEFRDETTDLSGVYGLYVVDLTTGYSFGIAENDIFQAASLIKLPIMAGMYQESEAGRLDLDSKYQLKSSDRVGGAGSLSGKPVGYETTYRNLIYLMGKQSDNSAFHITREYLGEDKFNQIAKKIGMTNTSLSENNTTPKDIGVFFEELWKGNAINSADKDELLSDMTDTIYEQWLKAGVPKEVRVAHKYGREVHVINDAGIVYAKKPYVVVIMTKGVVEPEGDEVFPTLSKIVYDGMTSE